MYEINCHCKFNIDLISYLFYFHQIPQTVDNPDDFYTIVELLQQQKFD